MPLLVTRPWKDRSRARSIHALLLGPLLVAITCLAACGSNTPSATTLLSQAQKSFNSAQTFHFQLQTQHPGAAPDSTSLYLTGAEGDAERPNSLKALATVSLGGSNVTIQVIAVGTKGWYQNPLTGQYIEQDDVATLTKLFDPQTGIGALLTKIQNPSQPSDRSINGTACWYISGTLPGSDLSGIAVGTTPPSQVPVTVCVDKGSTSQLDYLSVTGQLIAGDTAQTEHDIYFSKYGESVSIQAPTSGS